MTKPNLKPQPSYFIRRSLRSLEELDKDVRQVKTLFPHSHILDDREYYEPQN